MTLQDLGSIGEFVAAIATILTLIYLALQIRHDTQESRATSRHSVSQSFVNLLHHISGDAEVAKPTRSGFIDPESLDDDEMCSNTGTEGAVAFNPAFRRQVEELGTEEIYQYTYERPPTAS